jgi:hypothetical protein
MVLASDSGEELTNSRDAFLAWYQGTASALPQLALWASISGLRSCCRPEFGRTRSRQVTIQTVT